MFKWQQYCVLTILCMMLGPAYTLYTTSWRVLCYMDASDKLTDMAFKNITDMLRGSPDDTVELYVQLHAYDQACLRYKAVENKLMFIEAALLSEDQKQNLVNAVSWAFQGHDADHTMVIFWNHGWGALDPRWNAEHESWEAAEIALGNEPQGDTMLNSSRMSGHIVSN